MFKHKEYTNPDGLTKEEFLKKYEDIETIAEFCWWIGAYPEELKNK